MRHCPLAADKRIAVFLGRVHGKKGLLPLLEAWSTIRQTSPEWHLVIAGPDEAGHAAEVASRADQLQLSDSVSLVGPVYGAEKQALLRAASVFVLPSFSEGFSVAVLEAMAAELPVLITPGCNFPEAGAAGAAAIVEPTLEGIRDGLGGLLLMPDYEREEMGRRGHHLVLTKYSWETVAQQMLAVYQWVLGEGPLPGCVQM